MRKPRLEFSGAFYHVIARGNRSQKVFFEDGDRVRYLNLLGEWLDQRHFVLYAYCLMDNHVHLLIEQETDFPLSRFMQRLQSAYTLFIHHKYRTNGHLFQGRYKAILVDKDDYLLELVRYIHLNPVRADLEHAERFPWSSHWQYLGREKHPLAPVRSAGILEMFSSRISSARKKYLGFLKPGRHMGDKKAPQALSEGRILGDEAFVSKVRSRVGKRLSDRSPFIRTGIGEMWERILKREGITREPQGYVRSRLVGELSFVLTREAGYNRKQIAEHFGVEPSTVTKAIRRLEDCWAKGMGSEKELLEWGRGGLAR